MPTRTANCPRTTLPSEFASARKKDRCCRSAKVSKLNVEKVVYPPRKPTTKKSRQLGWTMKPLRDQYQEEANGEASRHVDDDSPIGEAYPITLRDPTTQKIPGITAKKTANTDQKVRHAGSLR